mmetsp:Transcript_3282/g.10292  ORF Transcript_3282/g.10292 Transcript_3282/m.10292 type:complete len:111 (+) Transcript_3282:362-694(+)
MASKAAHYASVVLLVHAGLSTVHFKTLVDDASLVPPPDVVVEVVVAFLLATYAAVSAVPALKPVRCGQDVTPETQDTAFHAPDFEVVHHRGKSLAARRRALAAGKGGDLD